VLWLCEEVVDPVPDDVDEPVLWLWDEVVVVLWLDPVDEVDPVVLWLDPVDEVDWVDE
jgi:hypothetical protein